MASLAKGGLALSHLGWLRVAVLAGLSAALAGSACATEVVSRAPFGEGGASSGTASGGHGGGGGGTPPRRTVVTRSPFGNVAASDNLLWDGDFEWLSSFSDQYGWLVGANPNLLGYELPKQAFGASCKSGVKCIELKQGAIAVGIGVASAGHALEASVHAMVEGDCASVEVALVSFGDGDLDVALESSGRVDGWCRFDGAVAERKNAVALYVRNGTGATIRVDDAVIHRAPQSGASAAAATPSPREFSELKRELRRRARPAPRPRGEREEAWMRELRRRRAN